MNQLESTEKPAFCFKDEFSDLLALYDKPDITRKEVKEILDNHSERYGRLGFKELENPVEIFYNHLHKISEEHRQDERKFLLDISSVETNDALVSGINKARTFFPGNLLDPKPVLFFCGPGTNAKVLENGEFGINLCNLFERVYKPDERKYDIEDVRARIESLSMHESTHIFSYQLEGDKQKVRSLVHVAFGEGLATFVEERHHTWHDDYVNDSEFFIDVVKKAVRPDSQEVMRDTLQEITTSKTMERHYPKAINLIEKRLLNPKTIDGKEFNSLINMALINRNGPLYHLGYKLWEDIYKEGGIEAVKKKILEGPKSFEKYFL